MNALDIQHDIVCLVNLVNGVCQLAPAPVFGAVNGTAGLIDHTLVTLNHGRYLFALVRVDQEHDFIMPHCVSFRLKSRRAQRPLSGLQLPGSPGKART